MSKVKNVLSFKKNKTKKSNKSVDDEIETTKNTDNAAEALDTTLDKTEPEQNPTENNNNDSQPQESDAVAVENEKGPETAAVETTTDHNNSNEANEATKTTTEHNNNPVLVATS